jgi:tubulin polyglutamylase TTLL6/13
MDARARAANKKGAVSVHVGNCRYDVVADSVRGAGWKTCGDADGSDWNIFWTDTSVSEARVMKLKRFQKINHFPGMEQICRKVSLAKNMARMRACLPEDFGFVPRTWCLPAEREPFEKELRANEQRMTDAKDAAATKARQAKAAKAAGGQGGEKGSSASSTSSASSAPPSSASAAPSTYICKPDSACQGKGIFMTQGPVPIDPLELQVAQEYIPHPLLIDGYKFDLRLYALVVSCDPLQVVREPLESR